MKVFSCFKSLAPNYGRGSLSLPGASLARLRPRPAAAAISSARCLCSISTASRLSLGPISLQALLPAGAVGPGVASLAVIAKRVVARSATRLLTIAACSVSLLRLIIGGTVLGQVRSAAVWLTRSPRTIRLVRGPRTIRLVRTGAILVVEVRLVAASRLVIVLSEVAAIVLKLLLIAILVEFWLGEVGVEGVAVEFFREIIIVAVDVINIGVDVIAVVIVIAIYVVDVGIDVVAVVIVIAVDEGVGIGDVNVAVVSHTRVMPAASP